MDQTEQPEEAVFEAALRLPADQRAAYLDQTCGGDAGLRRRVKVLLGAFERAGGFMKQPAAPERTARFPLPPTEKPGDKIGRYKLLQQIGEGGCGVVYMAEQEEPVRRRVALKVIKLGMDTKQVIARFEAERQALALMDHPNIAKVLEAGATETGRPYFVMELVRGIKITDFCDENNISTADRLRLFIQVCQAIQHAHQKGVIHRDIKPSNILVTVNDGVPVPKVIDFGIAKATQGRLTDQTLFTAFEQFIGTPAYMSPEQAVMTSLDIDTRSDIYSLGVLLYELLTGGTPFDAKELLAAGLDEMRRTIRETEPPKPSTRLGTMLDAERTATARHHHTDAPKLLHLLRGDLDWIVMKSLDKDRARRYETANGLAMDIERHLHDEPVIARPPTRLYRFQKSVQRNKLAFAAVSAVVAALVIGLTVSTVMSFKAQAEKKKAQTEAAKSQQVAKFLKDMLNSVGPSRALGRDTRMLREVLDKTVERAGKDLTNQPEVEAELRSTIGGVYKQLADYDKAEAMDRSALAIRRKLFGNEHTAVADSLSDLGAVLWDRRNPKDLIEAEELNREAWRIRTKLLGRDHPLTANSLTGIADVLLATGRQVEAEPIYREALATQRRLLGDDHPWTVLAVQNVADALFAQGRLSEAETLRRQGLATARRVQGNDDPLTSGYLYGLGDVLRAEGKLVEAESAYREALVSKRKVQGAGHPATVGSLRNLAATLHAEGKLVEAEALYRELLAILKNLYGNEHPDVAGTLRDLGNLLRQQGKLAEVETLLRQTLAMASQSGTNYPGAPDRLLLELGLVLQEQGKLAEAETLAREVLADAHSLSTSDRIGAENLFAAVGSALRQQNKYAEAELPFREALTIARQSAANDAPRLECRLVDLASVLRGQGKFSESELLLREVDTVMHRSAAVDPSLSESWSVELGYALQGQNKFTEAEPQFRKALALARKFPANNPSRLDVRLANVGDVLRAQGKYAEAESLFREADASARQFFTNDPARLHARISDVAEVLRLQGKVTEAKALLEGQTNTPAEKKSEPH